MQAVSCSMLMYSLALFLCCASPALHMRALRWSCTFAVATLSSWCLVLTSVDCKRRCPLRRRRERPHRLLRVTDAAASKARVADRST